MKPVATDIIHKQQTIDGIDLNYPIKTHAAARPLIGDIMEDVALVLFGGSRLRVNSERLCPDIIFDGKNIYGEIKSVGQTGASHLYKIRVQKYKEWMSGNYHEPITLRYIYIFHNAKWEPGDTRNSLREKVITSIYRILMIDSVKLHRVIDMLPIKKFNIPDRPELSEGYRLTKSIMNVMWALSLKDESGTFDVYNRYATKDGIFIGRLL